MSVRITKTFEKEKISKNINHKNLSYQENQENQENSDMSYLTNDQSKYIEEIIDEKLEALCLSAVEKIIDKKMDTISMIIESKVNQKLRDMKKWAGPLLRTHVHPPSQTIYKGQTSESINIPTCSNNAASVNTHKIKYSSFGTENYRYISLNTLCYLIKTITDFSAILQKIVKELYFNISHKENNNVLIHPNAYKNATIFIDGFWRNFDQTYVFENVARRANDVLQHYMINPSEEDILKKEIGKKRFEQLQFFTDKIDNMEDHPDFRQKILDDTEHTIVTNQHLVHPQIFEPESTPSTV